MKMKKIIFLILTFSFLSSFSLAQSFEYILFENVCNELIKQNNNYSLKSKISDFFVVSVDPVEDKYYIDTVKPLTVIQENLLKDLDKNSLLNILLEQTYPFFPLGESFFIKDTIEFFHSNFSYTKDGHVFKIVKDSELLTLRPSSQIINLFAIGISDDKFGLVFEVNRNNYYSIYLNINNFFPPSRF